MLKGGTEWDKKCFNFVCHRLGELDSFVRIFEEDKNLWQTQRTELKECLMCWIFFVISTEVDEKIEMNFSWAFRHLHFLFSPLKNKLFVFFWLSSPNQELRQCVLLHLILFCWLPSSSHRLWRNVHLTFQFIFKELPYFYLSFIK